MLSQLGTCVVVSLGLVLGTWAVGVTAWFLRITRPYRQAKKALAIRGGQLTIALSCVSSFLLLTACLERMGVARSSEGKSTEWAYIAGFGISFFVAMREELRWRKPVDL